MKLPEKHSACQRVLKLGSQGQGPIEVGKVYCGQVTAHKNFGVFLNIGARSALLHKTRFPPRVDLKLGSKIQVRVTRNDFNPKHGKPVLYVDYVRP